MLFFFISNIQTSTYSKIDLWDAKDSFYDRNSDQIRTLIEICKNSAIISIQKNRELIFARKKQMAAETLVEFWLKWQIALPNKLIGLFNIKL